MQAVHFLGNPEGKLALAQAVTISRSLRRATPSIPLMRRPRATSQERGPLPVPLWIRNPVTGFMKEIGYGKGYRYPHEDPDAIVDQEYFPEGARRPPLLPSRRARIRTGDDQADRVLARISARGKEDKMRNKEEQKGTERNLKSELHDVLPEPLACRQIMILTSLDKITQSCHNYC